MNNMPHEMFGLIHINGDEAPDHNTNYTLFGVLITFVPIAILSALMLIF